MTLFVTPFVVGQIGAAQYGFWITSLGVLGYLGLLEFGLGVAVTRYVAVLSAEGNRIALGRFLSSALASYLGVALAALAIGWSIADWIPSAFDVAEARAVTVTTFRLLVVWTALGLPLGVIYGAVAGQQRIATGTLVAALVAILAQVGAIPLLLMGWGLPSLAIANIGAMVVGGVAIYRINESLNPGIVINLRDINREDLRRLWGFSGYFQLGRIANTISVSYAPVLIGAALGPTAVAIYTFSSRLPVLFSVNIASRVPAALMPGISELFASGDLPRLRELFLRMSSVSMRLGVVSAVFVALQNEEFVGLWVGDDLYGGTLLNAVFVYWAIQDTLLRGITVFVHASADLRGWAGASMLEAGIAVVLALVLVGPLGLLGVALATAVSRTLPTTVYTCYKVCQSLELSMAEFSRDGLVLPVLRSVPSTLVAVALSVGLPSELGWFRILAVGATLILANVATFELPILLSSTGKPLRTRLQALASGRASLQ